MEFCVCLMTSALVGIFITLLGIRNSIEDLIDDFYEWEEFEELDGR